LCISLELLVECLADGSHRRQREQLAVVKRCIRRPPRDKHAGKAKFSAIEFPQRKGIGDRGTMFQLRWRGLRVSRNYTAKPSDDNGKKSQRKIHT
jgi:hypothetical protein